MLRLCATAVLVAAALAGCGSADSGDGADRGDTAALVVGGDTLPPSDVEEFTSFDAEQLAATCGDAPQLPSQNVCSMPFLQGSPGTPIVIVRATFPDDEQAYFAVPREDSCEADPAACPEPVELTAVEVAEIVAALDLNVDTSLVTPGPTEAEPSPSPSETPLSEASPTDGAS